MGFLSNIFGKGSAGKAKAKGKPTKSNPVSQKATAKAAKTSASDKSQTSDTDKFTVAAQAAQQVSGKVTKGAGKAKAAAQQAKKKASNTKAKSKRKRIDVRSLELDEIIDITAGQANRRLAIVAYSTLGVLIFLILGLVFIGSRPPEPAHVVTVDPQGNVNPLPSFLQPPSSPTVIMNLAQRYTLELLEMNALNYEQRILENSGLFIGEDYFRVYESGLKDSIWFQGMVDGRLSMTGIPTDLPVISNSGTYSAVLGMTQWQVQVPVRIRIEGPGVQPRTIERTMIYQLVHARSPEYRAGIAIAGMRMERR